MAKTRAVICASPHAGGVCDALCADAVRQLEERFPCDIALSLSVVGLSIEGCIGCDRCRRTYRCFQRDDMGDVLRVFDVADELYVASPVYFAGPPSQFKALLDRLQPRYWEWLDTPREQRPQKKPAHLLAVGEGGDPHGCDPLVACTRSALAPAGFDLAAVQVALGTEPDAAGWLAD